MKTQGHIAWAGQAWVGPGIDLFLGQAGHNQTHRHMAVQLAIGLDAALRVWTADKALCAPLVAIRAGTLHRIEAGRLLSVYLDPFCAAARAPGLSEPLQGLDLGEPDALLLALLGAPAQLSATWFALLTVHLAFQHANLDYDLGPLRRLLAVAQMHRWHHKRDFEDAQVNFGEFLLVWDWMLGSYHDSAERLGDAEVGLRERDYPRGYLGQLLRPFRRVQQAAAESAEV